MLENDMFAANLNSEFVKDVPIVINESEMSSQKVSITDNGKTIIIHYAPREYFITLTKLMHDLKRKKIIVCTEKKGYQSDILQLKVADYDTAYFQLACFVNVCRMFTAVENMSHQFLTVPHDKSGSLTSGRITYVCRSDVGLSIHRKVDGFFTQYVLCIIKNASSTEMLIEVREIDYFNQQVNATAPSALTYIKQNQAIYDAYLAVQEIAATKSKSVKDPAKKLFDYSVYQNDDSSGIEILRYKQNESIVIVPQTIETLPVVSIGPSAFQKKGAEEIILPNCLEHISSKAFADCKSLQRLSIPYPVKRVAEDAFINCDKLELWAESPWLKPYEQLNHSGIISITGYHPYEDLSKACWVVNITGDVYYVKFEMMEFIDLFLDSRLESKLSTASIIGALFSYEFSEYPNRANVDQKLLTAWGKLFTESIDHELIALIEKLSVLILTDRNIDKYIEYANVNGKETCLKYLINYKAKHFEIKHKQNNSLT